MNIDAAIAFVEGHIDYGTWAARSGRTGNVELSLDRMHRFIELLGNPQVGLPIIHVTGTNGKGSTSRMITRLLMAEGLRVGTYSSPHLARYNERFRLNDIDIDDTTLAALLTDAADAEERLGERLMPFEVLTGAAYTWFAQQRVDVAVIEVGVLGRFDATNVGDGCVAVVTNIGFDHTDGEGDWQQRIAGINLAPRTRDQHGHRHARSNGPQRCCQHAPTDTRQHRTLAARRASVHELRACRSGSICVS